VNAANGSSVTGAVSNNSGGDITIADGGTATFGLGITNFSGGSVTVGAGSTLSSVGNLVDNRAGATLTSEGTVDAIVSNAGTVNATNATFNDVVANSGTINATDTTFNAAVGNSGTINGTGNLTFGAGLTSSGTVSTVNGAANDVITLGANSSLGGTTLRFDIDLDPAVGTVGASDRLVITSGTATGNVTLAFTSLGVGNVDLDDLLIIDAAGAGGVNNLNVGTPTFAPPLTGGSFVYFLVQPDGPGGDLFLRNQVNPGITALAGNVTLTQSLIGSIINRPSSPFVSGLAYDDPDPCGTGLWARAILGQADATGNSTADAGLPSERTTGSSLSATYAGVQLGGDFACFNGYLNGWDVAAGGIGGVNLGTVDQPVTVPGLGLNDPAITTSVTEADFLQYYAGVYATASRGPLSVDLQYRLEKTDFTVNNTPVGGGAPLGITDSDFSSKAQTLSGSISYGIPIGDSNFAVVPTAGFAWTRTSTDPIIFDNGDRLLIDDFDSRTAFVGATLARTIFSESGDSLQRQFITASYYNDFADDPTATFDTGVPVNSTLVNENLGAYTEISAGWNYVRILNPGQIGAARQLDASIRADARIGDQLNSYGITGQLRLQF
jgi:outer membrane autotransporter protein